MILKNIKDKQKGFTIVELLVVIVVIGILAAITIVSYTGITARANGSKAVANAQSIISVAEAIGADEGKYPVTIAEFGTLASSARIPAGITISVTAPVTGDGTTKFQLFTSTTAGAAKGGEVVLWDYAKANLCSSVTAGNNANGSTVNTCMFWGAAKSTDTFVVFAS